MSEDRLVIRRATAETRHLYLRPAPATPIIGRRTAGGTVKVPLADYEPGVAYWFEYEAGRSKFRWTDQSPISVDDQGAIFDLPLIGPIVNNAQNSNI